MTPWPPWQLWLAAGILLMIAEMATPGFVLFFFGVAALFMAGVTGVVHPGPFTQALLFVGLSIAGMFFFRKALRNVFSGKKIGRDEVMEDGFVGKPATVVERVTPQSPGKVEFNGTHWRAVSDATLEPGAAAIITARDNLTLSVTQIR